MVGDQKHLINGILTVIGGMLVQFAFGHFYTLANMTPYILSYIDARVEPNVNDGLVVWLSGLGYSGQGITMPIGGFLAKKIDYRIVLAIGCLINSGSIMLTYLAVKHSFAVVIITYAILNGAGLGLAYSVVMEVAGSYFPKRQGLVVGIVVGGYGLSALVFTPVQSAFINRENLKVDERTKYFRDENLLNRVPNAFLLLGGTLLAIQVVGTVLMRARPKPKVVEDEPKVTNEVIASGKEQSKVPPTPIVVNLKPLQVLRRLDFYLLWITLAIIIIPISIFISSYKLYGQSYISDDSFLTTVVTLTALFNWGGRVIWGMIADKVSFKFPLCVMLIWYSLLFFTFPHLSNLSGVGLKAIYTIWVFQMFFCLSATFVLLPAAVGILFGPANLAVNYGILFNASFVGSMIIGGIMSAIKTKRAFMAQYTASGGICLLALFVLIWVSDPKMPRRLNLCRWFATRCGRGIA